VSGNCNITTVNIVKVLTNNMCLSDGAATGRYMVCIARHVGPAEKTMPAFSLQQFTTKQDLNGRILACDTRFVRTVH